MKVSTTVIEPPGRVGACLARARAAGDRGTSTGRDLLSARSLKAHAARAPAPCSLRGGHSGTPCTYRPCTAGPAGRGASGGEPRAQPRELRLGEGGRLAHASLEPSLFFHHHPTPSLILTTHCPFPLFYTRRAQSASTTHTQRATAMARRAALVAAVAVLLVGGKTERKRGVRFCPLLLCASARARGLKRAPTACRHTQARADAASAHPDPRAPPKWWRTRTAAGAEREARGGG